MTPCVNFSDHPESPRIKRLCLAAAALKDSLSRDEGSARPAPIAEGLFAGMSLTKAEGDLLSALLAEEEKLGCVHRASTPKGLLDELIGRIGALVVHDSSTANTTGEEGQ